VNHLKQTFLLVICFFNQFLFSQYDKIDLKKCLHENTIYIDSAIGNEIFEKARIDSITSKYIFIGEQHYLQFANNKVLERILNSFSERLNIKLVVFELAFSWQEDFNNYVITGDEVFLESMRKWWHPDQVKDIKSKLDVVLNANKRKSGEKIEIGVY